MVIANVTAARDEIFTRFRTQWLADTPAITGTAPEIRWQGVEEALEPPSDAPWVRVTVLHATGEQSSMGETGNRSFDHSGIVTVQVFVPFEDQGFDTMDALVQVAIDAFEGQTTVNRVWFRNVRINEIGPDRAWINTNVISDFEYRVVR